jgi:hypothetical protein
MAGNGETQIFATHINVQHTLRFKGFQALADSFNFGEFRANAPRYIAWCESMKPEPWKYCSLSLWEWIEGGMILPPEAAPERDPLEGI